jgi:ADP-heptose:LPS heptosyltransferase
MNGPQTVLLIHPGGLGDLCLAESAFLSLHRYFGSSITAVGRQRALALFSRYFGLIASIDSRAWGYLFSENGEGPRWGTIVFFGKDRSGAIRKRLQAISGRLIFIEMYPDQSVPVEDFQLKQLPFFAIPAVRKVIPLKKGKNIIVYPERTYRKEKWQVEHMLEVYRRLKDSGYSALLMAPHGQVLPDPDLVSPEDLANVAAFFTKGGYFLSNDSGMAHFAARCGMCALTLFPGIDPVVWRPRNGSALVYTEKEPTIDEVLAFVVAAVEKPGG